MMGRFIRDRAFYSHMRISSEPIALIRLLRKVQDVLSAFRVSRTVDIVY